MEHDISTFVDRPRPKTATTLSVTGLNKRVMDGYWKQLQNSYSGPKDKSAPSTGRTSLGRPSSAASLRQTVADSSSASSLHSLASSSKRPLTPSASSSGLREAGLSKSRKSEDLHKRALRQVSSSESKDNIPNLQDFEINFFTAEEEAELNSSNILGSSVNRSKSPKRRISAQVSTLDMSPIPDGNGQTMSNQANTIAMHELMTREYQASIRAERKIAMLAKEVPADFHVSNVLDVHLTKRRINLGEKGMLEKGLALEKDGDFESASICYSRAGAHSKDPQISRMLLGNLHYRANHLMMALRCYNTAIEIVESKVSGLRVIDDEFLGYHNRAVINFRLGNDSQGLADLQKAVTVNPTNLPARELLSLVKRRMGMYSDAMEDAHVVKIQRIEEDRLKREQAEKLKKQRAAKVRYNHDGKVIIHGRQRSKGVVAGIAHSNQTAESSMTQQQQLLEARQSRESALRGLEIAVPDPSCLSSLRERIASHRSSSANNALDDEDGGMAAGGFLRLFKMTHGMKNELFDEIFIKPTELQMSMLREPHLRTYQDIEIISTSALGVIPYLRNLAPSVLNELSAVVEYRAVSSGGLDSVLFKQNQESPGVCFLLTGNVGVTMETGHVSGIHGVDVVKLQERTAFGHFDLMFHNPRTSFLKSLEEVLVSVRSNITERLRPADHHHDDNNNNNPSAQVQGISHAGGVSSIDHTQHSTSSGSHQMSVAMMMLLNGSGNGSGNHHTMQTALSASQQIQLFEQEKLQQEQLQKEKTDFNQLFYHQVDHQSGKLLSRGVQPGMFMSYIMSGPCELLLINERDFYRILYDHSVKAFQQRIQTLRSCGIFQGWKHEDLIRLARMSQLFTFKRGETILQQAKKPDYLYIIQKGLCKVLKRPNRTEMLMQKLQVAKEKAARIDFKYVYHHGVYNPKDLSWEPLRDLTTPLFAAPTGPSVEELAAAEIAAASAIAVVDQSPAPGNNNNATSGAAGGSSHLPRLSSAATVATGNTMNSRPRTSQSRSSVSSRTDIPRTSSNLTTASAGAHSTTTKSQSQRSQSSRELLHHVDAAQAAAMLHPHDNRLFSPNHAQHPAVSPSAHAPHDGAIAVFSDDVEDADHRYQQHNGSSTHQPGSKHHRAGTTGGMKRRPSHLSTHGSFLSVASASPHHSERRNSIVGHHPGKHNGFRHLDELRSFPTSDVPPAPQQTPHELERQALAREIARLESLIKVAREQDAIDQRNHETQDRVDAMRLKRTESFYSTTSNSTPLSSKGECTKGGDGVPIEQALASQLNRKQAEIKLLQWPMIFGEACVLQPDVGVSRGSIVADTTVECIVLHRMQLQTFAVDDHFLDRVRDKAVVYPGDPDIVVDLFRKQNWQQYKLEVMQDISKSRWPKRLDDLESFVV
jgi:CRP-like cAMP-binding protein/tetratricopeptide (TPR) repeat protein